MVDRPSSFCSSGGTPAHPDRIDPVDPLGSGVGGGVELTLDSLVHGLSALGHPIEVVAPAGSLHVGANVHQVDGALHASSQLADRTAPIELTADSVLAHMWDHIADMRDDVDVVPKLAYDWLPFYLTRFFEAPRAASRLDGLAHRCDGCRDRRRRSSPSRPSGRSFDEPGPHVR